MFFTRRNIRPTAGEAARRLLALKYVAVDAHAAPPAEMLRYLEPDWTENQRREFAEDERFQRDQFWSQLRKCGLWRQLSPSERKYAKTPKAKMSNQQWLDACWRIESAQILMWALGLLTGMPAYDTQAGLIDLNVVPHENLGEFIKSAQLRHQSEIDRARDLAELWHWRSRTRQLIEEGRPFPVDEQMKATGYHTFDDAVQIAAQKAHEDANIPAPINTDFPVNGKAYRDLTADEWSEVSSITRERHFALNWLCGYAPRNRWDKTPTNT
jgi:Domain of unknown function (DUF4272)